MSRFLPKPYKKFAICVRLDEEIIEQAEKLAAQYNMSRSEMINQCMYYAIGNLEPSEQGELSRTETEPFSMKYLKNFSETGPSK